MSELKPCPFCGHTAWQPEDVNGKIHRRCAVCNALVEDKIINTRPIEDALAKERDEWKRRAELAEDPQVISENHYKLIHRYAELKDKYDALKSENEALKHQLALRPLPEPNHDYDTDV